MIYFTADPHYGHKDIIDICNRQYKNIWDMQLDYVTKWNELIKPEDTGIIVGDYCWDHKLIKSITPMLNGKKMLILGNHDDINSFDYVNAGFQSVHTSLIMKHGNYDIAINHDPVAGIVVNKSWIVVCGHVHTLFKKMGNIINVGVDQWDGYPVSIDTIVLLSVNKQHFIEH